MNTLITGVVHAPRGHYQLEKLYKRILLLSEKIPKDAAFRKNVEAIICHRLSVVKEAKGDRKLIEDKMCSGTLEMLISQAENEFKLMQKIIFWNAWEPLIQLPPPGQWDWPPIL